MSYIKFQDSNKKYQSKLVVIDPHTVEIIGSAQNLSGFGIYTDNNKLIGNYFNYKYDYEEPLSEGIFKYTDDGHKWVEPIPPTPPTPIEPTLQELIEQKVAEMDSTRTNIIENGVTVKLSDGSTEQFSLTSYDQISLMGLQSQVAQGTDKISWHTEDESVHCKYYSNEDMNLIVNKALIFVTFHVTYFRDLRIWIRSIQSKEELSGIYYGEIIPSEYRSEVLNDLYAQMENIGE